MAGYTTIELVEYTKMEVYHNRYWCGNLPSYTSKPLNAIELFSSDGTSKRMTVTDTQLGAMIACLTPAGNPDKYPPSLPNESAKANLETSEGLRGFVDSHFNPNGLNVDDV